MKYSFPNNLIKPCASYKNWIKRFFIIITCGAKNLQCQASPSIYLQSKTFSVITGQSNDPSALFLAQKYLDLGL